MIDIVKTAKDITNYKLSPKLTDNYQENFIRLLWNSYGNKNFVSPLSPIDSKECQNFLSVLNLEDIYDIIRNLNVYVINTPVSQLYHLSGSSLLTYSVMVDSQKFCLTDFKDYIRKNTNDTFFLYQINRISVLGISEYYIRYKQIKIDYPNLLSIPKNNRRLLWERKLKLEKLSEI